MDKRIYDMPTGEDVTKAYGAVPVSSSGDFVYEKEYRVIVTKAIIKEKVKQFKLGKYTDKYMRTYLEFTLMEGMIDNLTYLEHLKEIGEKV